MFASIAIGLFIIYLSQIYFIRELYQEGISLNLPKDHIYFKLVVFQENKLKIIFLIASVISFIFLSVFGVLLSHRVAGPIVKINNFIEDLTEDKDPGTITFRKKDFFKEFAETINKYLTQKREKGQFDLKSEE